MVKRLLLTGLLIATMVCAQLPALAQEKQGSGFRVSPVRDELTISKGEIANRKVSVMNLSQSKVVADVVINDFDPAEDESGQPRILMNPDATTQGNSFKKIASTVKTVTLEPRQTKEITVTISIPKDGNPGGYYGALRFADSSSPNSKTNVALAASVGTLFLVTVPGNLKENMAIVEFTAAKNDSTGRFFINSGKMSMIVRLKNTGNIHVKPFGTVQVSKGNQIIEEYELNNTEPRANVLPNSTRKFKDNLKNQKWIGKYTVTANIGYGSSGGLITAKTYFWIIPAWFVIAAAALVFAIIVVAFILYRRYKAKNFHKSHKRR